MKILVVGSGAREHAICWKIAQSQRVSKIYCAPGNAGISKVAECIDIKAENVEKIVDFAEKERIDITVIGPEAPLVAGLADLLKEKGLKAFGPVKKGAALEGSKAYSKEFMRKYNIPTAKYETYSNVKEALIGLKQFDLPLVVKADGLAAGKGVIICQTIKEAEDAVENIMQAKQFGDAGNSIVVEEFLDGIEASLLCFVDGKDIIPMESARDYKKAFDNDQGLNTGGMGCFSPNPIFNEELHDYIKINVLQNTLRGFIKEDIDFRGVLFIGLMIKNNKAKVLEYNVRFGDPETEVILPRLESDLVEIIEKTIDGTLTNEDLIWKEEKSVTVILASGGYPVSYEKGKVITGLEEVDEDIIVFHGGTKIHYNNIITNGGRVLAVTALGTSIEKAREEVYKNINKINFEKKQFRKDIERI